MLFWPDCQNLKQVNDVIVALCTDQASAMSTENITRLLMYNLALTTGNLNVMNALNKQLIVCSCRCIIHLWTKYNSKLLEMAKLFS